MSLYDGLGVDNSQHKATGWSPSFQMLKSQLQVRKATLTKAKNEKTRGTPVVAPVIDFNKLRQEETSSPLDGLKEPQPSVFLGGEVLEKYMDEYDPMRPNDYEKMTRKDREQRERQKELDREKEIEERRKRRAARHAEKQQQDLATELADEYEAEAAKKRAMPGKAAIAPPTALLESDKVSLPIVNKGIPPTSDRPASPSLRIAAGSQFATNLAGSVAHKIMAKYGFKEGKGLGKDNRGMSHALQVEKTSKRGGKIISSDQIEQQLEEEHQKQEQERKTVTDLLKNPTKVICLRNMVGPGEVDAELEGETSDECSKYGTVVKCLIYEMHNVSDDEAIRIFIEFDRLEASIKALVDLNGRFFGGRTVKASFYDHSKFKDFQLAEPIT